ncbi:MAG TPA: helix-turn-helix transcriptional regulator [Dongiaceae bacterium]|nr:helix-turn-helix transcriptional regulator [Dongiaceae bacterium]
MLNNGVEGSQLERPTEAGARPGLVPMLQHADVWRGIDRLAAKHGLSASGLARRAGLDPTAFNPSKRITREGRPRWPSTESVAKILTVTGESFSSFVNLTGAPGTGEAQAFQGGKLAGRGAAGKSIPVVALARLATESCFDQNGQPVGSAWGRVNAPGIVDRSAFAIEINGHEFDPVYRDGDLIIASPEAEVRRGDRIVAGTSSGAVMLRRVGRQEAEGLYLEAMTDTASGAFFKSGDIRWIARVVWASQ